MSDFKFQINGIRNPRMDSIFRAPPLADEKFELAFRMAVHITDDRHVAVILGTQVSSVEIINDSPKIVVTAEMLGLFIMEQALPPLGKSTDLKCLPNMMAILLPYIRERVSYCFSGNDASYYLPPINTVVLLQSNAENPVFQFKDDRLEGRKEP